MAMRFEYKYKVPVEYLDDIRRDLTPFLTIDPFANKRKEREYTVRSIYFDNTQFDSYMEKIEGLAYRNKFRIRGYNENSDDSIVFLEIKRKLLNNITKSRAPLPLKNLSDILTVNWQEWNPGEILGSYKNDAVQFMYYFFRNRLQPVVLIVYDREAWMGRYDNSLRITFDKNLRSVFMPQLDELYENDSLKPALYDHFVLELKFHSTVPTWFRYITRRYNLVRTSVSKYTICIDSHLTRFKNPLATLAPQVTHSGIRIPAEMLRAIT